MALSAAVARPIAPTSLGKWYGLSNHGSKITADPAGDAFKQAVQIFNRNLTRDPKKARRLEALQATSLQDVVAAVREAQRRYTTARNDSKAFRCLAEVSKRLHHYGNVMDVFVQHHPEYVSLAWGTMKLLFGAIVEHENIGTTIVTGLCDIADALPRVGLAAILYPTDSMQLAVANLYANIIRFLLRALEWYEAGSFKHAIHSITKPVSLRYDDIIKQILVATRNVQDEAVMCSHIEQRDMHEQLRSLAAFTKTAMIDNTILHSDLRNEVRRIGDAIDQLKADIMLSHAVKSSSQINTRLRISDLQANQMLGDISRACRINHQTDLLSAQAFRNIHQGRTLSRCYPFWLSPQLQRWDNAKTSSQITLTSTFKERHLLRQFCTNMIDQLLVARVTVLWALKSENKTSSVTEVLQSLIVQALKHASSLYTANMLSVQIANFLGSTGEQEYAAQLTNIFKGFNTIYIVVDADMMPREESIRLSGHLFKATESLIGQTDLKILTMNYGPRTRFPVPGSIFVLNIKKTSRRRTHKMPSKPFKSIIVNRGL